MNETAAPKTPTFAPVYPLAALIGPLAEDAARRRDAIQSGRQLGPVTGFDRLDTLLSGCLMPGLHTLHGGPGVGKSAFALGVACACGVPALFASCELGTLEILRRLIARETGTYLGRLKSGELTGARVEELARQAVAGLPLLGVMDATTDPAPISHLSAALSSLREAPGIEEAKGPGALLIVDSLHTWAARNVDRETEYDRLGAALDSLEQLAKAHDVPVLLIAERNRASMGNAGQNSGAGNRRIEYSGESVFALDGEGEDDAQGWRKVKLTVGKNRHGATGTFSLRWHGARQIHEEAGEA